MTFRRWLCQPHAALPFAASIVLSGGIIYLTYHRLFPLEMAFGWAVAVANGYAANTIHRAAVRANPAPPLFWALGMNGLRIFALIALILLVNRLNFGKFVPFFVAMMAGYFGLLFSEIIDLHSRSLTSGDSATSKVDIHG